MSGGRSAALRAVRRPPGLVEQTRWLFCLCVLLSLLLTLPGVLVSASRTGAVAAVATTGVLVAAWVRRYVRRSAPPAIDLAEALAVLVLAAASPNPAVAFSFAFSTLWFRALYGSSRSVALYAVGMAAAMAGSIPLWHGVPGHTGALPAEQVLGPLPVLLLTVGVARHLALGLFAREQSQQRDAALADLGTHLLGVTDREEVYALAWRAAGEICTATPGLRVLVVSAQDDGLLVRGHAGEFTDVPVLLPAALLPDALHASVAARVDVVPPADASSLTASCAVAHWLCVPMPELPDGTMLLGHPGGVPCDGVVAIQSMMNQVALALRTSDAHQDLATQAHTDSLTGLANRAAFGTALQRAVEQGSAPAALLFLDLDDFKTVNDRQGHAAGDELLRLVAGRLSQAVGEDDLCARLGGDEFAVLLTDADGERAVEVAQRLVDLVAAPLSVAGRTTLVGASVGVAHLEPGLSPDEVAQNADVAMYAAKARGKHRVQVFAHGLLPDEAAVFEDELAHAATGGQLVVHYQPILSAAEGRCDAVEALVRWQHPTRGLLAPGDFIAAAERTGAIVGIGAEVLRSACGFAAEHTALVPHLAVHVNVSAAQLRDDAFPVLVSQCLRERALTPDRLVLEITESMVLDSPTVRTALQTLSGLGVALAIDDFGTGYSALTTLRTLPLDIVKIDKSFVAGCPDNRADHAVVEAIVQMASRLGLRTVAEGVERPEQQQFLQDAGVDALQGYLQRRPGSAADVGAWLRDRAQPPGAALTLVQAS